MVNKHAKVSLLYKRILLSFYLDTFGGVSRVLFYQSSPFNNGGYNGAYRVDSDGVVSIVWLVTGSYGRKISPSFAYPDYPGYSFGVMRNGYVGEYDYSAVYDSYGITLTLRKIKFRSPHVYSVYAYCVNSDGDVVNSWSLDGSYGRFALSGS